jgi:phospholipid/cholesterol/gamma-HCH transport system permease protein
VREFSAFEDYVKGMIKAVFFGVLIAVICCYQGLRVRGGAAGVGQATTGAVVTSIILVFGMNFVLSLILFWSGTR